MTSTQHSDSWRDRIQDALDNTSGSVDMDSLDTELRAHIDGCEQCRSELAKLSRLHRRLSDEFENVPTVGDEFSTRVFARIEAQEEQRRAAKLHAEHEFRRRAEAFTVDWRGFLQRHFGSVVAALTVAGALIAALSSTLAGLEGWVRTATGNLPWSSSTFAVPVTTALVSTAAAGITIWWLQSRAR